MHVTVYHRICAVSAALAALPLVNAAAYWPRANQSACRALPGDAAWPTDSDWNQLNTTIGGKLILGKPLAQPCYSPTIDADRDTCVTIRDDWTTGDIFYEDPVNVMSPYWLNDSCSPYLSPSPSCTMGNMAVYAIDVDTPETVAAGLKFAQEKNIRLSIKNTGHDYIGRSNGQGSLALWTHNLKNMTFFNYSSPSYTGPAVKAGAGIQFFEAYKIAADNGFRVLGGYCPTVGMVGGYVQGGGHGPLSASYGMAADNTLEFEVVTVDGQHLTASPTENSDLYWALSGGGAGNYAVVLSLTAKAHPDGNTAGATLSFANTNPTQYWAGVAAWQKSLLTINTIPHLATSWGLDNTGFSLNVATLTDGTQADLEAALQPFLQDLKGLNISLATYNTSEHATFYDHYEAYTFPPEIYATNSSLGGRLISPSTVENNLTGLVDVFRQIVTDADYPRNRISAISLNVTHERVGNAAGSNAVLPAWRDALYTLNVGIGFDADAATAELQDVQAKVNEWQALFTPLTPGGGGYMNEATFDDAAWKEDYYGANYDRLLEIKKKYDPGFALWQHTSVGMDAYWELNGEGRLCRV
ncbi:FAD-binding domain-containing protein [Jackrogersella minutella]|nr:FAD-binding domain-containing protein [Jackrogersella minutella]